MILPDLVDRYPPAEWWGHNEDRDFLLGLIKHGMDM
jgi:hypothetical protein